MTAYRCNLISGRYIMKKISYHIFIVFALITIFVSCREKKQSRSHQQPYAWDSYNIPDVEFEVMPVTELVDKINKEVSKTSNGEVNNAIVIDSTPVKIATFNTDPRLTSYIEQMIKDYRENEKELIKKGACGYESTLFSGPFKGNHSFVCLFMAPGIGLKFDPQKDALYLRRTPNLLECRIYGVSDGLKDLLKQLQKQRKMHVDTEPMGSAFIRATDYKFSWSVMVPYGHNSWRGHTFPNKVFKYIPDLSAMIVIAVPDEHKRGIKALKKKGLWLERKE